MCVPCCVGRVTVVCPVLCGTSDGCVCVLCCVGRVTVVCVPCCVGPVTVVCAPCCVGPVMVVCLPCCHKWQLGNVLCCGELRWGSCPDHRPLFFIFVFGCFCVCLSSTELHFPTAALSLINRTQPLSGRDENTHSGSCLFLIMFYSSDLLRPSRKSPKPVKLSFEVKICKQESLPSFSVHV